MKLSSLKKTFLFFFLIGTLTGFGQAIILSEKAGALSGTPV
jgi:hypothetical protein